MSNRVRKCNKIIIVNAIGDVAREKSSTNEMETYYYMYVYLYRTLQRILYCHNNMLYDYALNYYINIISVNIGTT